MKPDSNQPARLYGTAKTLKLEKLEHIAVTNLKFRPTTDQTGTFTYNVAKVICNLYVKWDYLRALRKNKYSISNTQKMFINFIFNHPFKKRRERGIIWFQVMTLST